MKLSRFIVPAAVALLLFSLHASAQPSAPSPTLLGMSSRVELACENVITSLAWWTRMGFLPVPHASERPDSMITISDGQVTLTLTKRSQPSPSLVFQHPDLRALKDSLERLGSRLGVTVDGPSISEIRLVSPNGIHMAVRSASREPWRPHQVDSNQMCGKLTELSIGTSGDMTDELIFWERLGFTVKREGRAPYHYALLTDGHLTIGIHDQRDIPALSLTYFAKNMADRLDVLRASGLTLTQESITSEGRAGSAIATSPDGQRVMLFNGDQ